MPRGLLTRLAVAALLCLGHAGTTAATPFLPASDDEVLAQVPVADPVARELRRAAAADPHDLGAAVALAAHWARLARTRQDSRYAGYAEAALAPWWDQPTPPVEVLLLRAALHQHRHAFDAALADLERARAAGAGGDPRLWLQRAGILRTRGEPHAALASCRQIRRGAARTLATICAADAMAHGGAAAAALILLDATLGPDGAVPAELAAWTSSVRAEVAERLGRWADAERSWRRALAADPEDEYARLGLADLLLDQGRPEEVAALLDGPGGSESRELRRVLAARALGERGWRGRAEHLRDRFVEAYRRGDTVAQREEARLLLALGDPPAALAPARASWAVQREPWDARVLLEAALAAGDRAAAGPVLRWLGETRLEDPRLSELAVRIAEPSG